jgi:hypothetical protein
VDRHRFETIPDPDPTFQFDFDPDPDPTPTFAQVGKSDFVFTLIHSSTVPLLPQHHKCHNF